MALTILVTTAAFGQQPAAKNVPVVTVCEVLSNPTLLDGKQLFVLGRFVYDQKIGMWLSEDDCGHAFFGNGKDTPMIWLEGKGDPPQEQPIPKLDMTLLKAKFEQVVKTTKLGKHSQEYCSGNPGTQLVCNVVLEDDHWAVVYGEVDSKNPPKVVSRFRRNAQSQLTGVHDIHIVYPADFN